jgi:hypothetical protein
MKMKKRMMRGGGSARKNGAKTMKRGGSASKNSAKNDEARRCGKKV